MLQTQIDKPRRSGLNSLGATQAKTEPAGELSFAKLTGHLTMAIINPAGASDVFLCRVWGREVIAQRGLKSGAS